MFNYTAGLQMIFFSGKDMCLNHFGRTKQKWGRTCIALRIKLVCVGRQKKIVWTLCPTTVGISSDMANFGRPLSDDQLLFAALIKYYNKLYSPQDIAILDNLIGSMKITTLFYEFGLIIFYKTLGTCNVFQNN